VSTPEPPAPRLPESGDRAIDVEAIAETCEKVVAAVETVIEGKRDAIRLALAVLLSEGHVLVEDVPGVGKTMLAKALARAVDCSVRRIQFTPDLLPSDITGVSVFNPDSRDFEFRPGAVFANIVIGDEINRASPKTQSALLECMAERQVTVDGVTYVLEPPFLVFATQNPLEMEGTYPLPEAQRDRFTARLSIGYPSPSDELEMIDTHASEDPLEQLDPVTDAAQLAKLVDAVRGVHVAEPVKKYAVDLVTATRDHADLRLGASPRATLHLVRTARAVAAMDRRDYVVPDDLQAIAVPVLAHRLLLTAEAQILRRTAADVVAAVIADVALPEPSLGRETRRSGTSATRLRTARGSAR
jgi:MoxR-like ATPase